MPGRDRKTAHSEDHFLLMALRNGPLPREEISNTYRRVGGLFGIPTPAPGTKKYQKWQRELDDGLSHLLQSRLIVKDEGEIYRLTERGLAEANTLDQNLGRFTGRLRVFLASGKTAARVSIIVNALLSVLKLGVGL